MAFIKKLAATLALAAAGVCALAQGGPGGFGPPNDDMIFQYSPFALVRIPEVATELKVTADQKTKLATLQKDFKEAVTKKGEEMRDKGADWQDIIKEMQKVNDDFAKKLNEVLTADQQKRQSELKIQQAGATALFQPDVQKDLALTDKQKEGMNDLMTKQRQANMVIGQRVQSQEITWEDAQRSFKKNNDILKVELVKLLTTDQAAKFKTMSGKPFTFPKPKTPAGGFGGPPMGG